MKSSHAGSSHSDLLNWAPSSLKKSVELASEKDASSWLTVLLDRNIGMVLLYIRLVFMMPSHLDMADASTSSVVPGLPLNMCKRRLSSI